MANLKRVIGDPLSERNLDLVIKELEETAAAATLVGTSVTRLKELAALIDPIADGLFGVRPEVRKVVLRLRQRAQDVTVAGTRAYQAPAAVRALAGVVENVKAMLKKGIGSAPKAFTVGKFEVENAWGYTEQEAHRTLRLLDHAEELLLAVGLEQAIAKVELVGSGQAEAYDTERGLLMINPSAHVSTHSVLRELGIGLWETEFGKNDREVWGGEDPARFARSFASAVRSRKLDQETAARLQVTVGRLASRWPEVA